ncbi:MAG: 4Fe-4S binding protein [Verrucomicrobia bacterium]|nr:4Fe-4S binding protein [Verrucomicrobiota bacterium]
MLRNPLKFARVALAVFVFAGFTLAFVDFRGFAPPKLGHALAHTQYVPGLVSLLVGGGAGAVIFVVGTVIALVLGRIYCSAICPLGIFQDVIARISGWFRKKKKFLPYAKPFTKLRHVFLWGTVAVALAGWGGFALALLDPYSNYGRIVSMLARPLLTVANNSIVVFANAAGIQSIYRVDTAWASAGLLILPAIFLTAIAVMSALRGRLYCNSICPVGTALGLVSRFSALRIAIDKTACTKCGDCLRSCKAQCIDLRTGTVDASRCVACYNCIGACDEQGIHYRFSWKKSPTTTTPAPDLATAKAITPNPQRREFLATLASGALAGATSLAARADDDETNSEHNQHCGHSRRHKPTLVIKGEDSPAVSPPGAASTAQFLDRCTACHLCISACPTHVLQPALFEYGLEGLLRPKLEYSKSYCLFECTRCGEVCPDGAITPLSIEKKSVTQIGVADLYLGQCVVRTNGTDCAACSEHCPTKAVTTRPFGDNLRLPVLDQNLCIGCGACEYACPVKPVKAIIVTGRSTHAQAQKLVEKQAPAPNPVGDFPF